MNKKRFQIFIISCFCVLFLSNGLAKSKSKLSKLQNSIKGKFNSAVKQTKESFNRLVKNSKDSKKKECSKEALFNALVNLDQVNIKGLDIQERRLEQRWKDVDKFVLEIFWANQAVFTKTLEQTKAESKDKARLLLHEKILEKYINIKTPLINFAVDLQKEGEMIRKWLDELSDLKNKIKTFRDEENKSKLDKILEKLISFGMNVERLSIIVCELLS